MSDMIATQTPRRSLRIHRDDNVCVALVDLPAGATLEEGGVTITLAEPVRRKHKFTLEALSTGDIVTMYGVTVGRATRPIPLGGAIGTGNVEHSTDSARDTTRRSGWQSPDVSAFADRTFEGYHRADGKVGTANYWLVVPLVFCENRNIEVLRECVRDALGDDPHRRYKRMARSLLSGEALPEMDDEAPTLERPFPNVDGVRFLTHSLGCGGTREDARALCQLLAGYICHPNVAGATVLSLGCQNAQASLLKEALAEHDPDGVRTVAFFEQQALGDEETLMRETLTAIFDGLRQADRVERQPAPLSKLVLGVECGGSDGFSGISANPLVGAVMDRLVTLGGSGMLSEFPELCGVEHELRSRCVSDETAERFRELMAAYQRHAESVGADFSMNPSPGNIRDGLITDAMKSAGAARKGGDSPIVDVLDYTEPVRQSGLSLLCTPGNDVESTTALAGSGANLILFTTGLGTPTGNPVVPVLKIASNSELATRMHDAIDFDAGPIVEGRAGIDELADELLTMCLDAASGRYRSCAVRLDQQDFIPWKRGVSL
ncbi:UxaA family hydrolase [Kushneria phosphatilytica]|uniref:Altronate dehydratase n=1 Tax=Kushneria phosphatilytica TaxID=657387 RepID=A0A1S1NQV5_9GAMM|nr:altronate dehydratase family protein [Kushneria phosphatilytica]OHV08026.1 altronate hydrolase [Kushneria phosphatilytica]QEL09938.1 altronate dehydratase [Kushneria phosphatilytica]